MGLRERHRANQVLALSAVLVLAGGWVALTRQGAQVAGVSFWEAFDHRGPVASALDATRFGRQFGRGIDVTAVFTILVALAYATVGVSRRLTAGAGGAGGDRRGLGAGRTGHLRARRRPRPRPAGDRPGRPARRRRRDLDRRTGAAGRGHAPRHARPRPAAARRHPRQDRRALLADGRGRGGGAGGDRRPAGAVGAVLRVADLDDLLRPHAAGKDAAALDDAGGRVAQPPVPGPVPDAAALGHRRTGGAVGGGGRGCPAHQPAAREHGPPPVSGATTATGGTATVALAKRRADQRLAGDGRAQRDPAVAAGSGRRRPACTCSSRTARRCPRS